MKNLIFYQLIFMCLSCKKNDLRQVENKPLIGSVKNNSEKINTEKLIKLPIGEKNLVKYNFPKEWNNLEEIDDTNPDFLIEKISKEGYDSIFYFIEKNTDNFVSSLNFNKKNSLEVSKKEKEILLKFYDNSVIIDSAYFVGSISKTPEYTLKLYKNGNKYKSLLGSGNEKSSFNYLYLTTFSNEDIIIDSKIIYYNNYDDFQSYKRFFYIDENSRIYLNDFGVNELHTERLNKSQFKISEKGFFTNNK